MIHPTAIIDPKAQIDPGASVGPYANVGPDVRLDRGVILYHHASVDGHTHLKEDVIVHPFAAIGGVPQDLKYRAGEPCFCVIGERTIIRESATVNAGTEHDVITRVGRDCLLMAYSHLGHNTLVGDNVVIANAGTLGGHVVVEDFAIVGGLVGVHQFVRIGKLAIIGGCSKVVKDVPPFMLADGSPARVHTINHVGMERRGFSPETMRRIKWACQTLFHQGHRLDTAADLLQKEAGEIPEIQDILHFIQGSKRGLTRGAR